MAALLRRSSCFGQPHDECCARSRLALHMDRSALLQHEMLSDRQTESAARRALIKSIEAMKDFLPLGRRNPLALIGNAKLAVANLENDLMIIAAVFDRVVDEIGDGLLQAVGIGHRRPLAADMEPNAMLRRLIRAVFDEIVH